MPYASRLSDLTMNRSLISKVFKLNLQMLGLSQCKQNLITLDPFHSTFLIHTTQLFLLKEIQCKKFTSLQWTKYSWGKDFCSLSAIRTM